MQRRSHKVTGKSMFYIHGHIIKSLRHAIKFYILILYPTALNPPNKKIRLFNDPVLSHWFYMSAAEAHVEFALRNIFLITGQLKKSFYFLYLKKETLNHLPTSISWIKCTYWGNRPDSGSDLWIFKIMTWVFFRTYKNVRGVNSDKIASIWN